MGFRVKTDKRIDNCAPGNRKMKTPALKLGTWNERTMTPGFFDDLQEVNDARKTAAIDRDHLGGLVVKASASGAEDPGFESRLHRDFSGSSHTSDLKNGTPVATLPGAWHYRVSAGTGRPGVSIL